MMRDPAADAPRSRCEDSTLLDTALGPGLAQHVSQKIPVRPADGPGAKAGQAVLIFPPRPAGARHVRLHIDVKETEFPLFRLAAINANGSERADDLGRANTGRQHLAQRRS